MASLDVDNRDELVEHLRTNEVAFAAFYEEEFEEWFVGVGTASNWDIYSNLEEYNHVETT
jgi:hypothetical protein